MIQRAPKAIVKVHNYLYRFSLESLKIFQRDEPVMNLFKYYFENHAKQRIEESAIMAKYKDAYFEAAEMILKHTPHSQMTEKSSNFLNHHERPHKSQVPQIVPVEKEL